MDLISRQAAIDALHTWFRDGFDEDKWWNSTHVLAAIEGLPPAQLGTNLAEVGTDTISRQAAIDAVYKYIFAGDMPVMVVKADAYEALAQLPSAQPEDCDTCKHGYFGDDQCERCRVRYPSHYERRTDECTD